MSGNDGRTDLPILTISASLGWLEQKERFSQVIAGNQLQNYTLLRKGELSYNHGNSKLAKYGVVIELKDLNEALVPKVYHSIKCSKYANPTFLEYLFWSKIPDGELGKLISSSARMDGLLNISKQAFLGINITIPSVIEQTQIGNFFKQLDDTIANHQRELEKYQKIKLAYLEKMFV
ncbi:restriction endonuclease subunit S [Lonepinella koalarum]|uniref:restriction endonuclease subunit S n=1 Tax=Lonepinella koalarum TaxID=53417 RepID=UPI003F6DC21E